MAIKLIHIILNYGQLPLACASLLVYNLGMLNPVLVCVLITSLVPRPYIFPKLQRATLIYKAGNRAWG